MDFKYKTATQEDIDILVTTRIEVLRAANKLDDQADMTEVAVQSRDYYGKALKDGSHTAILVYDKDQIVGAGGISYFKVMPTYHTTTDQKQDDKGKQYHK